MAIEMGRQRALLAAQQERDMRAGILQQLRCVSPFGRGGGVALLHLATAHPHMRMCISPRQGRDRDECGLAVSFPKSVRARAAATW